MEEITTVSCGFSITCKYVLHDDREGWEEVNCNTMQPTATRSKLRGLLAERVHMRRCGYIYFAGEYWWAMKSSTQQ